MICLGILLAPVFLILLLILAFLLNQELPTTLPVPNDTITIHPANTEDDEPDQHRLVRLSIGRRVRIDCAPDTGYLIRRATDINNILLPDEARAKIKQLLF
ncbi:MAG: hypothetical protein R2867_17365 [Caldilineaceae bacterium]